MGRKVKIGQPFNDVEVIDAERRLRREKLVGILSIAVVGFSLMAVAVTGVYWLFTNDSGPIYAVHGYAIGAIGAILVAVVGAKPWFNNSS
jgi:hypothetical protein